MSEQRRLLSLDALRGFDMFWIVGAEGIVHALGKISGGGVIGFLGRQLTHKDWDGFAFYDLIFPLFVFIVGVSIVLSLGRARDKHGVRGALRRIVTRGVLLYVVGVLCYGGISRGFDHVRLLGVLQRIAICYTVTAVLFCTLRTRGLIAVCGALLVGYWALMTFVPIRDVTVSGTDAAAMTALYDQTTTHVSGSFAPGHNLANHIDFLYLPGRRWDGAYDPEGLLSTLPAIATCLLGVFAGLLLARQDVEARRKVRLLLMAGAVSVALGFLWGLQFPVVKKIWTSSFVLVAGGYSALLLAAFYQVIEVQGRQRWATPFVWIGMNPITIYLAHNVINFEALAARFVGGPVSAALGAYGDLLVTLVALAMSIALVRFMYQRKLFLRL
jgi:predicted acyltransferase